MKKITVSVDDGVYQRARVVAAQRSTSVSKLVAEYLEQLSGNSERFQRLLAEERRLREQIHDFSASDRLSRDELYDRRR
ncbi:MAG: DUF6364 family protein [Terriglobales bacterium]